MRHALAAALLVSTCALAGAQSSPGRNFAFLVACADYDPSELKPVPFTLREMNLFRDVLIGSGTPADNIVYLHDKTDRPGRFIPNRSNILKEYKLLLERLRPEDSLVVALSGHGIQYRNDTAGYFCPLDARLGPNHKQTLVPLEGNDGLLSRLEKTKAQRKLVFINACRNEPASSAFLAAEKLELRDDYGEDAPRGTAIVFSCGKGQRSYFYPDTEKREERRNRSLFMYHLTEAWKGSYAQGKKVTLDHVLAEVRDRVENDAARDFRNNQMPLVRKKEFEGAWVLDAQARATSSSPSRGEERVLFLVDMSGSMRLKDEATLDADKWPGACKAVMNAMKSKASMKQFQVLLFSDRVSHLGNKDKWINYEGDGTATQVHEALLKIKPEGSTNTYAAFEEAFRYGERGLDSIVLLSDGLPNIGPGLDLNQLKLPELEREALLSKYVLQQLRTWNPASKGNQPVRIHTIEFRGWTKEVGPFLKSIADEHGGSFAVVR